MAGFGDTVAQWCAEAEEKASQVVRWVIDEMGRRVIAYTPIDTGELVSNWNYSLTAPDNSVTAARNVRTLNHLEDMPAKAIGHLHFISSGVAHAYFNEVGTSKMEARRMLGRVELEFPAIVDAAVARLAA